MPRGFANKTLFGDLMPLLTQLNLSGFRSIRAAHLKLRPLNVIVGGNGAGKSNLLAFFRFARDWCNEGLQASHRASDGSRLTLYGGPRVTQAIRATFCFADGAKRYWYYARISFGDELTPYFAREALVSRSAKGKFSHQRLDSNGVESQIARHLAAKSAATHPLRPLIQSCIPYHFRDTSKDARIRLECRKGDCDQLHSDGGNLAAILHRLQTEYPTTYRRIVEVIRLLFPAFHDFALVPSGPRLDRRLRLNWRQRDQEEVFGPNQLSDGTLRAMCLVTLLKLPLELIPRLIIVDEPELGLHPFAVTMIASLLQAASFESQVITTTQSPGFLNEFDAEDVIVAEAVHDGTEGTQFRRLSALELDRWLQDFSLGDLWERNVIGGGPH